MSAVNRQLVETVLRQFTDPHLNLDPVSAGCVRDIDIQGGKVGLRLELGYACGLFKSGWAQMLQMALEILRVSTRPVCRWMCASSRTRRRSRCRRWPT